MNRRIFLSRAFYGGLLLSSSAAALAAAPAARRGTQLTILHTNDWHSRIEPFPDGAGRNANQGGAIRRAAMIDQIRGQEEQVLLLDSGDVFQGTPYFNFFAGELEFKLMSQMGYDAGTIGNHDFDAGIEGLAKQLPHTNFPLLVANYGFKDTPLEGKTKAYHIIEKGPIRIGIFGLGIELEGLVPANLYGKTVYQEPLAMANRTAKLLKVDKKCDLVICLSHLGHRYKDNKICDVVLAAQSRHIDLILGGHTHTFLRSPESINNLDGEPVIVNQAGWGGLRLGRLDLQFDQSRKQACVDCKTLIVS